jgi:hypothetical protein
MSKPFTIQWKHSRHSLPSLSALPNNKTKKAGEVGIKAVGHCAIGDEEEGCGRGAEFNGNSGYKNDISVGVLYINVVRHR